MYVCMYVCSCVYMYDNITYIVMRHPTVRVI